MISLSSFIFVSGVLSRDLFFELLLVARMAAKALESREYDKNTKAEQCCVLNCTW